MTAALMPFLRSVALFRELPDAVLAQLAATVGTRSCAAGSTILRRGEPGDAMFLIRSGEVEIPVDDAAGIRKFTAQLGAGGWFGEMALLTAEKRSSDVRAHTPVDLVVLRKDVLESLIRQSPAAARLLTSILGSRLRESELLRQVGKYRLLGELGRGGHSIVYTGVHPLLERKVAVKMLSHDLACDARFRARFEQEARVIAGLEHEQIVKVYDTEWAYATCFIVMELLEGATLADTLEREGSLPFSRVRTILMQLCSALRLAHGRGIVHRDLKPANVMVAPDGRIKLMDFGIAQVAGAGVPCAGGDDLLGTAEYMAPERIRGEPVDGRADLYALGVLAYEMLAGRPPFMHEDPYAVLHAHVEGRPVPLREHVPQLPDDLDGFVHGCLAARPQDRFQSVDLAARQLRRTGQDRRAIRHGGAKVLTLLYDAASAGEVERICDEMRRLTEQPGLRLTISELGSLEG